MTENDNIELKQAQFLKDLEKSNRTHIPIVKKIDWDTYGVKLDGKNVIGLGLHNRFIKTLPESIGNLKSLEELDLSRTNLSTLPESIGNLKSLEELDLSDNNFTTLPESIGNLKSLKDLNLAGNRLTTLPESISNLKSLHTLILDANKLSTLPESFWRLKNLENLNLGHNNFTTLPELIGNLSSLKVLWLINNKLSTLPKSIGNLKSLENLNLGYNNFTTLPESIGNLKSLEKLFLNRNKLTTLPESVSNLKSLHILTLDKNNLSTLPESISNLKSLEELSLSGNKLTTLPESFLRLKNLETLSLSGNNFVTLPESIGNLKSLKEIKLQNNQLTTLPESFSQLRGLSKIDLKNKFWKGEWQEIVRNDIPTILKLCRKLNGIFVFISHAMKDEKTYRILELSKFLENNIIKRENDMDMNIIHDAIICEEDLVKDIWEFMTENVPKSHLLVFIGTKNSITSEACRYELFLADKYDIEILPIKGSDIRWKHLSQIDLINRNKESQKVLDLSTPKEKFEISKKNFSEICEKLSEYIKTHESELKMRKEKIEIIGNTKNDIINSICSLEFKASMKYNLEAFDRIFQEINNDRITSLDYYVKLGEILSIGKTK